MPPGMRLPFRYSMSQSSKSEIRQVRLPSGRAIEIVYLDGQAAALGALYEPPQRAATSSGAAEAARDLTTCGACACDFVQPVEWDEAGPRHWRVTLRCPNCQSIGTVVIGDEVVDQYDIVLERGAATLARALHELVETNIDEQARRLRGALDDGRMLPEDF